MHIGTGPAGRCANIPKMTKRHIIGRCRVCRWCGQLTFEHVPPECAFNSSPAKTYTLDQWMAREAGERARWENDQKGSGYTALCDECNSKRGGEWYVPEFKEWAYLGADVLANAWKDAHLDQLEAVNLKVSRCYPARFVKQIVMMLLAINASEFGDAHQPLRDLVLTREATGLPERYRLYLGLYDRDVAQHRGVYAPLRVGPDGFSAFQATDILYPPFSYTLTIDESTPLHGGCEITRLAAVEYDTQRAVELRLPYNWALMPHDIGTFTGDE